LDGSEEVLRDHWPTICEEITAYFRSIYVPEAPLLVNPILGCVGIQADADLIVDKTLIDLKTGKKEPGDFEALQLLAYKALAAQKGHVIDSMKIVNFIRNTVYTLTVSAAWRPWSLLESLGAQKPSRSSRKQQSSGRNSSGGKSREKSDLLMDR
jgi:hypothetical protein